MFPFIQSILINPALFDEDDNEVQKQFDTKALINLEDIHAIQEYPLDNGKGLLVCYKTINSHFIYKDSFLKIHQKLLKYYNWKNKQNFIIQNN